MSDGLKIAVTALFGVFVFVLGQLIQRILIEPIQDLRRTRGKIAHALTFYANFMPITPSPFEGGGVVGESPERMKAASDAIRQLSADLLANCLTIPWYALCTALNFVPSLEAIETASKHLLGWSNSLGRDSLEHRKQIATALKLRIPGLYRSPEVPGAAMCAPVVS
jgi:hypothetical protein